MESNERTTPAGREPAQKPPRRVGTLTFGIVLVVSGILMLLCMFFPAMDFSWAIKLSPLALVSLGVETLLAARDGSRLKYDWVGMILCCLIVGVAMALFAAAWLFVHYPDHFFSF